MFYIPSVLTTSSYDSYWRTRTASWLWLLAWTLSSLLLGKTFTCPSTHANPGLTSGTASLSDPLRYWLLIDDPASQHNHLVCLLPCLLMEDLRLPNISDICLTILFLYLIIEPCYSLMLLILFRVLIWSSLSVLNLRESNSTTLHGLKTLQCCKQHKAKYICLQFTDTKKIICDIQYYYRCIFRPLSP